MKIIQFKVLGAYRLRLLHTIYEAYALVKDIPPARWCAKFYDEFGRHNLMGHYAALTSDDHLSGFSQYEIKSAPLRAAINEFLDTDYNADSLLDGVIIDIRLPGSFVPDYKAIAMHMLECIMAAYPQEKHPLLNAEAAQKGDSKTALKYKTVAPRAINPSMEHVRLPYKDA